MVFIGVCFVLYFFKLSPGIGLWYKTIKQVYFDKAHSKIEHIVLLANLMLAEARRVAS